MKPSKFNLGSLGFYYFFEYKVKKKKLFLNLCLIPPQCVSAHVLYFCGL